MEKYDITQQIEPVRRSLLNVLMDNLRLAEKTTFVHRLIYIAEHSFTGISSIGDCMENVVQQVNDEHHDEPLSGLLLTYSKYFCHIIEGSEDSLHKHLKLLMNKQSYKEKVGKAKVLVCYHHINQRFLPGWMAITGKPPTLVEKLDPNADSIQAFRHAYRCAQKLYKLALFQRSRLAADAEYPLIEGLASRRSFIDGTTTIGFDRPKLGGLMSTDPECLPEYELLDFLLKTQYTQTLDHYLDVYGYITAIDHYKDQVWPVPCEFVPYNIYDEVYEPVPDLITAKAEEKADVLNAK